jgi:hypothetical protein
VDFPFCGQVACLERHTEELKTGKKRSETAYLITSLSPDKANPEQLLALTGDTGASKTKAIMSVTSPSMKIVPRYEPKPDPE